MLSILMFVLAFTSLQSADKDTQPLVSATDPAYLSCTVWIGKGWSAPTARSARTPTLQSQKGFRAYAEVKVSVSNDGSCENTTTLYVALGPQQTFSAVDSKDLPESDGSGIRLIGWSPSGDKLLAQMNFWHYETDTGYGRLAVIYDAGTGSLRRVEELNAALSLHFGDKCEFDLSLEGWSTERKLLVKILRTPESAAYEQHFCVTKPRLVIFDIQRGTLEPRQILRPAVQQKRTFRPRVCSPFCYNFELRERQSAPPYDFSLRKT